MLEAVGCSAKTAANGSVALQMMAKESFDLILMDCEMPVMDGFEATKRIRELEGLIGTPGHGGQQIRRVPIVAVTAHALAAVHERCLAAGMDGFLVKPFEEAQLVDTLNRWLPARKRAAAPPKEDKAPDEAPGDAPVDLVAIERLRQIKGKRSGDLLRRVVEQFTSLAPTLAAAIREKAVAGDAEAVWRAAHSLKSSSAAVGAVQLALQCGAIESAARDKGTQPVNTQLDALDAEIVTVSRVLNDLS
jgi:CheY-like chemotaxis protein/HPt (histidine-containing phosphotransfer) domain-containing protein